MARGAWQTALLAMLFNAGCTDPAPTSACRAVEWSVVLSTDCLSAKELARRTSFRLAVSQTELDWVLDVYRRGFVPLERYLGAPPIATPWSPHLNVVTNVAVFAEPWNRGDIATGVSVVDSVLDAAHIDTVIASGGNGGFFTLTSSTHVVVNRNVADALNGVEEMEASAPFAPTIEGVGFADVIVDVSDSPGVVDIVYRRGWGDCFVECTGQFSWRVRVTPETAQLIESWGWGEPVPENILEFWKQGNPSR